MAEQAADQLGGPLDIVIANAAVEIRQPWDETAWSSGRQQFDANMLGTLELLKRRSRAWWSASGGVS